MRIHADSEVAYNKHTNIAEANDEALLLRAVKENNVDDVKNLLEKGVDPNTKDKINGSTVLHWACFTGNVDITKHLVEKGADIHAKDKQGSTAVHEAAYWGHFSILTYLVDEKSANFNARNIHGDTPLYKAIESAADSKLDVIKYLLDSKQVAVNTRGRFEKSPLHLAARYGDLDTVKYLIKKGADVDAINGIGETPVHTAAAWANLPVLKYLVEETKANLNAKTIRGDSPAHNAICTVPTFRGLLKLNVIKYLINDRHVDINTQGFMGNSLLHTAVYYGRLDIVKYLVEKGANINAVNDDGDTPLDTATKIQGKECKIDLIGFISTHQPIRAIHMATPQEKNEIAEYLEIVARTYHYKRNSQFFSSINFVAMSDEQRNTSEPQPFVFRRSTFYL